MRQSRAVARTIPAQTSADLARPFVWLATIACAIGIWGYLVVTPLVGR